jgi:hypothetical protein
VRKLSGWKRIGIVASVLWAIGGFLWGVVSVPTPNAKLNTCQQLSLERNRDPENHHLIITKGFDIDSARCREQWKRDLTTHASETRTFGTIYALVPIPFGWLIVWGLVRTGRWVRAGFVK